MRNRYLQSIRSPRPPEESEPDGAALEAQIRAVFPRQAVSDALRARIAETCRAVGAPGQPNRDLAARRPALWLSLGRWGAVGLGVIALAAFILAPSWLGGARERARESLAARVPAMLRSGEPYRPAGPAVARAARSVYDSLPAHISTLASAPARPITVGADLPATKLSPLAALQESRPDRYLIRDATLTLEVKDARQASRALIEAVAAARGYVADSHESVDALGNRTAVIEVRVPSGRFDGSLARIEALGKVLDKQVTAEDVTEEFVDSQARLRNLQQTEQRLRAHLGQAGRLADILLVENALTRVRGQIEQLEGRLRYLSHRIAYSTLTVTMSEAPRPQPVVPPQTYSSGKVASDAMRALVAFSQVVWSAVIWVAVWAVIWLPLALAGWLAFRWRGA